MVRSFGDRRLWKLNQNVSVQMVTRLVKRGKTILEFIAQNSVGSGVNDCGGVTG